VPLKYLVDEVREVVPVSRFRGLEVLHHSIPAFDLTGGPMVEEGSTIGSDKLRVRPSDVLISKLNPRKSRVQVVTPVGRLALSSTEFVVLRPRGITPSYLAYLLRSPAVRQGLDAAVRSVTRSQQRVEAADVLRVSAPVEDAPRQWDIANFLDRECERIQLLQSKLEMLAEGTRQEAAAWMADRLREREHRRATLQRLIRGISDGPFGSSLASAHYVETPETRVIRLGNIGEAEFRDLDKAFVSHEYAEAELSEHFVQPDDVIIAGLADEHHALGRACVVPRDLGPAINKADCYRVQVERARALPEYVAWALSYGPARQEAKLLSRGATRPRLNTMSARRLPVPIMSLNEQRRLTLEADDRRIRGRRILSQVSRLTNRLAEYRDALITEAVTGKLDVPRLCDSQLDESAHAAMEGGRPEILSA
jgi:type I restriction enzyme S subunit